MSTYKITTDDRGVAIEIAGVADRQGDLLEALDECRQGSCSCPTDQYEKVESMAVIPSKDAISIRLVAKPDQRLDARELSACLDYTLTKTGRPQQDA